MEFDYAKTYISRYWWQAWVWSHLFSNLSRTHKIIWTHCFIMNFKVIISKCLILLSLAAPMAVSSYCRCVFGIQTWWLTNRQSVIPVQEIPVQEKEKFEVDWIWEDKLKLPQLVFSYSVNLKFYGSPHTNFLKLKQIISFYCQVLPQTPGPERS